MAVLRKEYELSKFWEVEWNTVTQREGKKGLSRQTVGASKKLKNISLHIFLHHRVSLPETVPGWERRPPRAECCDPRSRQSRRESRSQVSWKELRSAGDLIPIPLLPCFLAAEIVKFRWLFSWNYGEGNQERQNGKQGLLYESK